MRIGVTLLAASLGLLALGAMAGCERDVAAVPAAAPEAKAPVKGDDPNQAWGTIKGKVVWGEKDLPAVVKVNVDGQDKEFCLSKGDVVDEKFVVDPKTKGVKNAFVWVMDFKDPKKGKLPIHPSLAKSKEPSVTLDQPCCAFVPHALAVRDDQKLIVKNSASKPHNTHGLGALEFNEQVPPAASLEVKGIGGQAPGAIVNVQCDVHRWMNAKILIFNHPYYMVTGADGKFEIKNVPAGKYRLAIWQEGMGWVAFDDPENAKLGKVIEIKADAETDLGEFKVMDSKD
jgi:hypothetical protein